MFGFMRTRREPENSAPHAPAPACYGCFGKLPIQAEFLKHNVVQREAVALDRWVQEGFALAVRHGLAPPADAVVPVWHGVLCASPQDRTVLFTLRPSGDREGRRYPFVIFTLPQQRDLERQIATIALGFDGFFAAAAAAACQPWRNEPVSTVAGCVEALRNTGAPDLTPAMEKLSQRSADAFLDTMMPQWPVERRAVFVHATLELFRQVGRRTPQRVPWGVRLPLATKDDELSVAWWLVLANGVLGSGQWQPSYLWSPRTDAGGCLLLFFRPIPAHALVHLLCHDSRDATVVDPAELPVDRCAADGVASLLAPARGSAAQLVDGLLRWRADR